MKMKKEVGCLDLKLYATHPWFRIMGISMITTRL